MQVTSILVGLGLAGLGAAAALLTRNAGQDAGPGLDSAPPVSTVSPAADSALLVASGAARQARQQAQLSGASATALVAGDSLMAQAEALTGLGRKTEAAILIERAAGLFTAAARPTLVQAPAARPPRVRDSGAGREGTVSGAPSTAGAAPAGPLPEPAAAPTLGDSATAVAFYAELERAVESRQLGEVQRLLPNLTDGEIRSWRSLFDDDNLSGVDASYRVVHVTRTDNTLYVRLAWEVHVTKRNGKTERKKQANEFTELTQGPTGWKQVKARKAS